MESGFSGPRVGSAAVPLSSPSGGSWACLLSFLTGAGGEKGKGDESLQES